MKWTKISLALVVLALVAMPLAARADTLTLTLTSGLSSVTITDGGVGDVNPLAGAITFVGPVGGWFLNVSTGQGTGILGPGRLDLNSADTGIGAPLLPLEITFTDAGLNQPIGNANYEMMIGGTIGAPNHTLTYTSLYNGNPLKTLTFANMSGAFSGTTFGVNNFVAPYSLGEYVKIDPLGATNVTISDSFNASFDIPEPATLSLIGMGLIAVATGLRRRLSK